MAVINTPGVYIQEISTLPASVAAVETAIPAFIGHTENAEKDGVAEALRGEPTRITSMLEYETHFGGPNNETLVITVTDRYDGENGQPATLVDRQIGVDTLPRSARTRCTTACKCSSTMGEGRVTSYP